jgi:hypothetical protein
LPARAAEAVKVAKPADRKTTTINVVHAALEMNPASAVVVVGAIARAVPEMAAVAASVAAAEQPKLAGIIARAAAAAAPSQAASIVVEVVRAVPSAYREVALGVSSAVPGSTKEIINAVAEALPEMKAPIDKSLARYAPGGFTVATVLDSAKASPNGSGVTPLAPVPRGPAVGPPYIPLSGTPGNVNPTNSGPVPPGGRGYAAP